MDKLEMTPEQQLAFDGFIDVMVQIYKMTSDKIDYSKARKRLDCGLGTLKERNWMDIARFRLQNLMLKNNEARVHRSFKIGCMRAFCFMFVLEGLVRNGRTLLRLKNEHI